jgi:hypothetical protein
VTLATYAELYAQPGLLTNEQSPYDLAALVGHGYRWLSFEAVDGTLLYDWNLEPARAAGLSPGVWGVTYGDHDNPDPDVFYRDGLALGRQAIELGAEHVMADIEACAKGTRSNAGLWPYVSGVRDGGWSGPVHLTTLGSPSDPERWDYEIDVDSFLDTGGGVFPQAYYNDYADYLPANCSTYWTRVGVPAGRLNMMIGLYTGLRGRIDGEEWVGLLTDAGIGRNLSIFMAQHGTKADWDSLETLTLADDPAPDWWTLPYPTNPNPPAVQQPRWLYPPDIGGGYEPSSDGPDVRAYKIAVCRLGRWPAPKNQFDEDYSNGFAHGKDNTVANSGIEGIQRQSGLDDTGNLGKNVFQVLRTALIPAGLPNAGEPAFTPEAIALLTESKWWQYPYEQGPGPKVDFPRSLYAPDWPGQPTPADGPDVQAYKRAVSRLGRWPWQQFSQAYTNEFAHGTSGSVADSGVEGLQRQTPGLDDTGNLSKKGFEILRRALIPPSLPHGHEYAFDEKALDLLKQANEQQGSGKTIRQQALAAAQGQVGYCESPPGSNQNKFGSWYGMNGEPWCAMFVTWAFEAGTAAGSESFAKGSYYAYVPYVVSDAQAGRRGLTLTSSPQPGDLVCYDWDGGGADHIGIFKEGNATSWRAIEGNTSTGNNSNGGQVMDRQRSRYDAAQVWFVRVAN